MKILLIQEAGRHIENYLYRESQCLTRAFNKLEHDTICWGKGYPSFDNFRFSQIADLADAIVVLEQYDEGWLPDLSKVSIPKIFWSIDGHCNLENHKKYCEENKIDIVLNSCFDKVKLMEEYAKSSLWFPNAFCDLITGDPSALRTVDVGYCGTIGSPARRSHIEVLSRIVRMHTDIMVLGDKMRDAIGNYKISFNYNLCDDINYRTFESMAAGALLVTNKTPGFDILFDDGVDCVTYLGIAECVDKIMYYLHNDRERIKIAQHGYENVHNNHTYLARARQIIKLINNAGGAK